jgi:cell division protein FtsB
LPLSAFIGVHRRFQPAASGFRDDCRQQGNESKGAVKAISLILGGLLLLLQYPLWLGKGSWLKVRELDTQVAEQKEGNARLKLRNDALDAEVRDLKQGLEAIEERARTELGMIKQDELFVQVLARPKRAEARK